VNHEDAMQLEEMLKTVITTIVDHPESVEVTASVHTGSIRLYLQLHEKDRRKIEGREAESSLRTLLNAAGGKLNKRVFLEFR